jgi:histidyl-tRNA synthetase
LPEEAARWSAVEHAARRLARVYGYGEIRTPLIEDAALFLRSVGETSDIVQKEMFRVSRANEGERADRQEMVLRPEGTASVVRAYLQHSLHKTQGFAKLFYLGPMFRAERPQAGRRRQFHQCGAEAIGSSSAWVDVEVILLCLDILRACGVADPLVWLSSMGCREDQARSAEALRTRLQAQREALCKECQARLEKNVFRVLDCKNPACHAIAWQAPASPFLLCDACRAHFDAVRRGLREAGVAFDDTKVFARGLDYYTRTVFEVRAAGLGAQDAVAAGGRYDHLVEELGGPSLGAAGFAAGIERILMAAEAGTPAASLGEAKRAGVAESRAARGARRGVYLAVAQPGLAGEGFRLVHRLRGRGIAALMDVDGRSLKAQLREADKAGCRFVAILGEAEVKAGAITLKDLEQGSQQTLGLAAFVETVGNLLVSDTAAGVKHQHCGVRHQP